MKNYESPHFIPPWQDAPTLCRHLCISETTLDTWVRQGILPPARPRGGKRMWKWSEVDQLMAGDDGIVPGDTGAINLQEVFNATRKAASGSR
jgi:predicted DNA-binding transcriptional regulator AlpA